MLKKHFPFRSGPGIKAQRLRALTVHIEMIRPSCASGWLRVSIRGSQSVSMKRKPIQAWSINI